MIERGGGKGGKSKRGGRRGSLFGRQKEGEREGERVFRDGVRGFKGGEFS